MTQPENSQYENGQPRENAWPAPQEPEPAQTQGTEQPWGQQPPAPQQAAAPAPSPAAAPFGQASPAVGGQPSPYAAPAPQGTPADSQQTGAQWTPTGPGARGEAGFFKALFDFRFENFITVKFSSFLYVVVMIVAVLVWLGQILSGIMFGSLLGSFNSFYGEPSFNAVPLILSILFGWIPAVIALIAMRLSLEFAVATVRTAQHTKRIAEATEGRGA